MRKKKNTGRGGEVPNMLVKMNMLQALRGLKAEKLITVHRIMKGKENDERESNCNVER